MFPQRRTIIFSLFLICAFLPVVGPARAGAELREGVLAGPQIVPYLIQFNWGYGSGAVTMYDPCTDRRIATPEFNLMSHVNKAAAYVRGSALTIKVKWYVRWGDVSEATVRAAGDLGGLPSATVTFTGRYSGWIPMTAPEPIPDAIRHLNISWQWFYKIGSDSENNSGNTQHTIYVLNKQPLTSPVYEPLADWTAQWCEGLPDDEKILADAILTGFVATKVIKYGGPGWDTAEILCTGDGMCGGMKEVFFDACGTQGVHMARSCYILRDADPSVEEKWDSMLILAPGLGRTEPTFDAQAIREVDEVYPCPLYLGDSSPSDDSNVASRRVYEFFAPNDGHCINFLKYGGILYLYDLSFGTGPWPDTFASLPHGSTSGLELYDFRVSYMNGALDYMRGKVYYSAGTGCTSLETKLDINSGIIPYDNDEFKYYWYTIP